MKNKIKKLYRLSGWVQWKNPCHCEPEGRSNLKKGLLHPSTKAQDEALSEIEGLRRLRLLAMTPFFSLIQFVRGNDGNVYRIFAGFLLVCLFSFSPNGGLVFAQANINMEDNIKFLKDMEATLGAQAKKIAALEEQLKAGENANRQLVNRLNELNSEYSGFLEEIIEDKKSELEKFNKAQSGFSVKKKEFAPAQEAAGNLFPTVKTNEETLAWEFKETREKFAQEKEALEAKVFSLELELELKRKEWEKDLVEKEKSANDLDTKVYVLEKEKGLLEKTVEAQTTKMAYYEVVSKEKENLARLLELTRESYVKQAGSLYYYLGLAYTQAKIYSEAMQAYAKSLEYEPNNPDVHCNLGLLYAHQGNNSSKMLYHLREALRLNPQIENREVLKDLIEREKDK